MTVFADARVASPNGVAIINGRRQPIRKTDKVRIVLELNDPTVVMPIGVELAEIPTIVR